MQNGSVTTPAQYTPVAAARRITQQTLSQGTIGGGNYVVVSVLIQN